MTRRQAAAFLDRDGTIIHDADYVRDPGNVMLLDGAAAAIARLNDRRIPVIVVTNQSGIARGRMTREEYDAVHAKVEELLAAHGAYVDAVYVCPHHPDFTGACECRKPGTLLYRQAADDHRLDLARSVYAGDRWRDVAPAVELGGRGILVRGPSTAADDLRRAETHVDIEVVTSLAEVADRALASVEPRPPRVRQP